MEILIDKTKKTAFLTGYYNQTFKQIEKALKEKLGKKSSEFRLIWGRLT